MLFSATFQSLPGPQVTANYTVPNAAIQPSLGRPLSGGAANATVNIVELGTMYGQRLNQLDLRFGKLLRFDRLRTSINFDLCDAPTAAPSPRRTTTTRRGRCRSASSTTRLFQISAQVDFLIGSRCDTSSRSSASPPRPPAWSTPVPEPAADAGGAGLSAIVNSIRRSMPSSTPGAGRTPRRSVGHRRKARCAVQEADSGHLLFADLLDNVSYRDLAGIRGRASRSGQNTRLHGTAFPERGAARPGAGGRRPS